MPNPRMRERSQLRNKKQRQPSCPYVESESGSDTRPRAPKLHFSPHYHDISHVLEPVHPSSLNLAGFAMARIAFSWYPHWPFPGSLGWTFDFFCPWLLPHQILSSPFSLLVFPWTHIPCRHCSMNLLCSRGKDIFLFLDSLQSFAFGSFNPEQQHHQFLSFVLLSSLSIHLIICISSSAFPFNPWAWNAHTVSVVRLPTGFSFPRLL